MLQMVRDITGVTDYGWNDISNETVGAVEALNGVDFNAFYVAADKQCRRHHLNLIR